MQGVGRNQARLLPHDTAWEEEFREVKAELSAMLGDVALAIEHVGSTAIPTISAKPILDVAVLVPALDTPELDRLSEVGYDDRGLQAPAFDRRLFVLRSADDLSLRHIHCCTDASPEFAWFIAFRDHLIAHPETAQAYEALKQRLVAEFADDRPKYTAGKHEFIAKVLETATPHQRHGRQQN